MLERPALLVIDLTVDFLSSWKPSRRDLLIARTNALVHLFRERKRPVIWVRQEFKSDLSDAFLEMRDKKLRINIAGTAGADLHPDLEKHFEDTVIVKKRYSPFYGTDLDILLSKQAIRSLVIAGINTHACVRMAAIDAYQRDMRVVLAREAIGSYDQGHAKTTTDYLDGKIAHVLDTKKIYFLMS
ncbi:aldehyde dehydrogenase [Notoacmeibacter marinus]|uniref:Aldehyde dehydrogenase n=1 Tax=Notoacmeibacter marinus TaxID=1876515 RepID=A0A231V1T0_9HYPH|nr:isochorismatase family cysteine hydrolase [Notoacmeibacter marinus]OXT02001.1 aldehyde dehydrogenase [Notoacmeibacter marinus]